MAVYTLFDTETTGSEEDDRIIQVGAMLVEKDKDTVVIDEVCTSTQPIKIDAMAIHHITPEIQAELSKGKSYAETEFKAVLDTLNTNKNYLIAHNLPFDLGMIEKEGFVCQMKKIDTLRVARHVLPDEPRHSLQNLRYSLGLYHTEEAEAKDLKVEIKPHDAIGDVMVMKLLLRRLAKEVQELYPNTNPMDKMSELSDTPVLLKHIRFGKHKGKTWAEVAKEDRGYLSWLKNNSDGSNKDQDYTIQYYLGN